MRPAVASTTILPAQEWSERMDQDRLTTLEERLERFISQDAERWVATNARLSAHRVAIAMAVGVLVDGSAHKRAEIAKAVAAAGDQAQALNMHEAMAAEFRQLREAIAEAPLHPSGEGE